MKIYIGELEDKEYYIIGCANFVYYAKKVHIIGFTVGTDVCEILYMIDNKKEVETLLNPYENEYEQLTKTELTRFKTFEDAQKEADRLNNIPENKKRALDWNNIENIKRRYEYFGN